MAKRSGLGFSLAMVLFILVYAAANSTAEAVSAYPGEFQLSQPNGKTFQANLNGDEWQSWTSTANDHTVIIQDTDGYWKYAEVTYGELQPSEAKVEIDPAPANSVKNNEWTEKLSQFTEPGKRPKTYYSSGSGPSMAVAPHPAGGPQNVLVLLVSFTDIAIQNTDATWSNQFFGNTGDTVKNFFKENSGNSFYFTPAAETYGTANDGIIRVTLNYAHPNTGASTGDPNRLIVKNALIAADPYINYASFDTNGNGYLETNELHIVTIVAGYERSCGAVTPNVWGHRWSLWGTVPAPQLDGKFLSAAGYGGYTQQGEIHAISGNHLATIGILCHELSHDLGMFDEYNTSSGAAVVGASSLMDGGSWGMGPTDYPGGSPAHLDPWGKTYLGFVTPTVAVGGIQTLKAASTGVYNTVKVPTANSNQYFLIENRNRSGFDDGLYYDGIVNGGIAIWHIEESVIQSTMSANTVNNGAIPGVWLEKSVSSSEPYFRNGGPKYIFSDTTTPNSKLYDGTATNISGTVLDPTGTSIRVDLGGGAQLAFNPTAYSVVENGGSVTLTVTRTGSTTGALTVDYATADGTAAAGSDYTAVSGTLSFADGEGTKTVTVTIDDDSLAEGDETFTVTLSNASAGTISAATATVTITDDDLAPTAQLAWNTAGSSGSEGTSFTFSVIRTGNTVGTLTVDYSTVDGTATAGSDYNPASGALTFADGETSKSMSVSTIWDGLPEDNESFTVKLSNPSSGTITASTVTAQIVDHDLAFTQQNYSVAEGGGSAVLTVYRGASLLGSASTYTVDYATNSGTATAGSDFTATAGTLSFATGEASKTITIPIIDDSMYEGNETFSVTLSNPLVYQLKNPTATVTISANDAPTIAFNPVNYTIGEAGGSAALTVTRTGDPSPAVSVNYATANSTASAGSDYTAVSGTLNFGSGETTKTINVPIIDDGISEGSESFRVQLAAPGGGAVLGTSSAAVVITDNDGGSGTVVSIAFGGGATYAAVGVGQTTQAVLNGILDSGGVQDITSLATWVSSNPETASVSGGAITGAAPGTTVVTATYNNLSVKLTVVVR